MYEYFVKLKVFKTEKRHAYIETFSHMWKLYGMMIKNISSDSDNFGFPC